MINRSLHDLIESLQQELDFLKQFCAEHDNSKYHFAKKIALSLRILLHDTKHSKSILSQLDVKNQVKFLDTAHPFNERNLASSSCLTQIRISSKNEDKVLPLLQNNKKKILKIFQVGGNKSF